MNPRTVFLVDTENVGASWKSILKHKNKSDKIYLFYTENSPHISYEDMIDILNYPNSFEPILCCTGKNALDFQLASFLGFQIKSAPKTQYRIFSKDTGYDALVTFWSKQGYNIERIDQRYFEKKIEKEKQEAKVAKEKKVKKKPEKKEQTVLTDLDEKEAQIVQDILARHPQGLMDIHNEFVQTFGMEKGGAMYKKLRPEIKTLVKEESVH